MVRTITMVMSLVLVASGCKKGEQEIATAENVDDVSQVTSDTAKKPSNKQIATGEVKELLLALQRVHFSFDSSTLTDGGKKALEEAAVKLQGLPEVKLFVDGHTDDRGTTEYNMSLGERRSQTVVNYLNNLGVEKERLTIVSFGEESPLVKGASATVHARNRRVDFRVMQGEIEFVLEESELVDDQGEPIQ